MYDFANFSLFFTSFLNLILLNAELSINPAPVFVSSGLETKDRFYPGY